MYYHAHFTDRETQVQRSVLTCQHLNPNLSDSKACGLLACGTVREASWAHRKMHTNWQWRQSYEEQLRCDMSEPRF